LFEYYLIFFIIDLYLFPFQVKYIAPAYAGQTGKKKSAFENRISAFGFYQSPYLIDGKIRSFRFPSLRFFNTNRWVLRDYSIIECMVKAGY